MKALACRLYPFHILQWVDGSVSVSFRFDCSAVSENTGAKILEREGEISKLLAELRQSDLQSRAKFSVNIADQPPLANMRETSETYLSVFQCSDATLAVKLHYMVSLVEFHSSSFGAEHVLRMEEDFKSDATAYFGEHLDEFAYLISEAEPHDRIVEMIFNYLLSGFARVDEEVRSKSFVTGRLGRIAPVLRFIMSKGSLRTLSREYPDTTGVSAFSALERAVLDWESNKVIDRYLAVQLRSLHFCGNPGPDLTFEEGVRHLALAVAAIISLAAFYANDEQQSKSVDASSPETPLFVTGAHTAAALRIVDHTFYHSPFFGLRHVRRMTKWLISERKFPSILKLIDSALAVSAGVSN
ncbi:MAG: hypothetical protein KAG97_05795, partial [Victivallales bacterium]|nr:hypothetical protein [Victivallales bacterium]